ncbi:MULTISPECIES: hypothetical protein [Mycolicibacterium]|uniref:Uncharacterized protein n=3 Tax=Mycolicibacterium TaxID=1866885 RepID=A0A378W9D3_9MYCO|nr:MULTISPECIES: hypothetical protein [Mycolicibacterium]KLI09030.1 hypothetical protein AA982_06085 [Mycolicibacterium senegalense]KLO52892.1 hypothetical protein ABW05_16670 [Mycolicibacterium senegalense]KMV17381.1 hypothetical protein ACT17_15675 [Mycolicibacterium conceptionense]MCV7338233.1 hypothetical protein [Mycolicibacterium senegalense]MCW1821749.1 hypothetical protein [Mycolicibacterium senegalense]
MPDDLLQYVIGPTPYSSVWLWTAIGLTLLLGAWYAGVFVLTSRRRPVRELPVLGAARSELLRRRAARAVRNIGNRYRSGDLTAAGAGAALSVELREFLHAATGVPAQYMQVDAIADSAAAPAAPILAEITDIQFNHRSTLDAGTASVTAEELIRGWT